MKKTGLSSTTLWRRSNPEAAQRHRDQERARWQNASPEYKQARLVDRLKDRLKLKDDVYTAYGGYICACCGETERQFLTLDHIANNGAAERRLNPGSASGTAFYRRLRRSGFPPGYQVLCWNCNCGKRMNGGVCPHQEGST